MNSHTAAVSEVRKYADRRNFYSIMGLLCALIVFVGFAPSYYLRGISDRPPLSLSLHLHGMVFTAWIVLFVAQAVLVRANHRELHRRLGAVGTVIAAAMVGLGFKVALEKASSGGSLAGFPAINFLAIQTVSLAVFACLVVAAICFRRNADAHKRLMLIATLSILGPAIGRLRLEIFGLSIPMINLSVFVTLVSICMLYDFATRGRVHAVYLWGGSLVALSFPLRVWLGTTGGWQSFASWLLA